HLPTPYTLSLHDALPISLRSPLSALCFLLSAAFSPWPAPHSTLATRYRHSLSAFRPSPPSRSLLHRLQPLPIRPVRRLQRLRPRSEEHTSELQSRSDLVC